MEACLTCFTETWQDEIIRSNYLHIDGFGESFRLDRERHVWNHIFVIIRFCFSHFLVILMIISWVAWSVNEWRQLSPNTFHRGIRWHDNTYRLKGGIVRAGMLVLFERFWNEKTKTTTSSDKCHGIVATSQLWQADQLLWKLINQ